MAKRLRAYIQFTYSWSDPKTGLEIRCVMVRYTPFPAVEWVVYLKNPGTWNTPILEKIQALDAMFRGRASGEFVLHSIKGDSCTADSYEPYRFTLGVDETKSFAPPGSGKSSDGPAGWPYFNLQLPGGGVIMAIGWPGQWAASFYRLDKAARQKARELQRHHGTGVFMSAWISAADRARL